MTHKIINGLHCIIDDNGKVEVYTESEYKTHLQSMSWWSKVKIKYNF